MSSVNVVNLHSCVLCGHDNSQKLSIIVRSYCSLCEYIRLLDDEMKHRDEQVEDLKQTVESLKHRIIELEEGSLVLPSTSTSIIQNDSELLFRYAGDIGTPHAETPRRALRGIRILCSTVEEERSAKKIVSQKLRQAQQKIDNLNGVIEELQNSRLISESLQRNMMVTPRKLY